MPNVIRSISDYASRLRLLLPSGDIWRVEPGSVFDALLHGLAGAFKRSDDASQALLVDAFPATTVDLLTEWERSLGLPDQCSPAGQSIAQREMAVVARLIATGGQSAAYFQNVANAFGISIIINEFRPFYAGEAKAGTPLYSERWAYVWRVYRTGNAFLPEVLPLTIPATLSGTRIPDQLKCLLRRYAPAHCTVTFSDAIYTG